MILMETDRRDLSGADIPNSGVIIQNCDCGAATCTCMGQTIDNADVLPDPITTQERDSLTKKVPTYIADSVLSDMAKPASLACNEFCNGAAIRIVIEDVPHKALVAGQIPIGLMSPDHEIFAKSISQNEMISRMIHPELQQFFRIIAAGNQYQNNPYLYADCTAETPTTLEPIDYSEAVGGDLMQYTTASGCCGLIRYYPTANYYDLSNITIETEQLPPDWYNLAYQAEYYARVESQSTPGQLNCIDPTRKATSVYRFRLNHPGQVMQETVRLTPAPYMTSDQKSQDTTIEFYRPFTDILQDIFDEQYLLGSVNWVDIITPQFVPYLCFY